MSENCPSSVQNVNFQQKQQVEFKMCRDELLCVKTRYKINTVMCVFSKLRICRSLKIIWLFCLLLSLLLHVFSASDGAAVHGPEGPRQRAVDCGAGSGGQERSQHQVRDHYFLTYTRHVHSCVCVPFRGCPVLGPRPGVGHERRTPPRHLTG